MCGIAGTVRIGDASLVERMANLMAHRGPDDSGVWERGDVRLAHRRLSIIDLTETGHQPMESADGDLVICVNGEIFNYRELRDDLEKKGHTFRGASDTEVILEAYREYGMTCLDRLEGMFALALWDDREGKLLLARDRTGIKPFYYSPHGDGLAFASEIKAFRLLPDFKSEVNRLALRSAVRYACNLEKETMLARVYKLMPGCWMTWKDGEVREGRFWHYPVPAPADWDEEQLAKELNRRLTRTVQSQMVSDAPLGAALSGGLDSSGIVALMAQSGEKVNTFTVGHGQDDPDLIQARIVAEHCKTDHHEIMVESQNVADLLPEVMWYLEEPLGQMEAVQMFVNYREAAKHVKVLLVGEGADECFAGYDRYRLFSPSLPLPRSVRRDLYERVYMYADEPCKTLPGRVLSRLRFGKLAPSVMADPGPRAAPPPIYARGRTVHEYLQRGLHHDQTTYMHHLALKRADATGMAHSLEIRVPYLDRRVVELASQIPGELLLRKGEEKHILRRALAPVLPESIVNRRKRPFQMRLDKGLEQTMDILCEKLLTPEAVSQRGFFEHGRIQNLRNSRPGFLAHPTAHQAWSYRIWSVILCEIWARLFLDRNPEAPAPKSLAELV